jgi:hypothetical protein
MSLDTPFLIVYAIAAIGLVVWLCALQFLLRAARRAPTSTEFLEEDDDVAARPGETTIRGVAEVAGRPADLAVKAAAHLAKQSALTLGPVKILEQTDQRVTFEAMPHLGGRFLRYAVLEFHSLDPERTRIDYAVVAPQRPGLLLAGWLFQALGLIALVVGFFMMVMWVAPHPHPAVRWQSFQMIHVVHFLWPPFLFGALYRRIQTYVRNTFDSFVHNLPYV